MFRSKADTYSNFLILKLNAYSAKFVHLIYLNCSSYLHYIIIKTKLSVNQNTHINVYAPIMFQIDGFIVLNTFSGTF